MVLGIVGEAYGITGLSGLGTLGVAYSAGLGAVAMAILWLVAGSVVADADRLLDLDGTDPKAIGGWTVLAASLLVPVALLFLAFPDFVGA